MATSVESSSSSPASLDKGQGQGQGPTSFMGPSSSPMFSPSSDRRFWSAFRNRIDTLLDNRKPIGSSPHAKLNSGESDPNIVLKEDSLLLLRGFDSLSYSLSQLSNNIEIALQGARDLARPPTLSEIVQSTLEEAKINAKNLKEATAKEGEEADEENKAEEKRGLKRKQDSQECPEKQQQPEKETIQSPEKFGNLKKAKKLAISMATKAASLARELRSLKSDLSFVQDRCSLLEEENRRLRDGFTKGIQPDEEDDLVRLQLEALLAEKSRLANENANLKRENQCLRQLVEYHQLTSQDLSASFEHLISGMCLDFSSPPPSIPEDGDEDGNDATKTPRTDIVGFSSLMDECYGEQQ